MISAAAIVPEKWKGNPVCSQVLGEERRCRKIEEFAPTLPHKFPSSGFVVVVI